MKIRYNGKESLVEGAATLLDVLKTQQISTESRGIAVAMNESVVPRRLWEERYLSEGDRVEVIHAVQGG